MLQQITRVDDKWTCHFYLHSCGKFGNLSMPLNAIKKFGLGILKKNTEHNRLCTRVKGVWEPVIMFYPCGCHIMFKCKPLSMSGLVLSNNHLEKSTKWDLSHPRPTWMVLDLNLKYLFYFPKNRLCSNWNQWFCKTNSF